MITRKQILIDQLVTDLTDHVNDEGQEKEIERILDKVAELKDIIDEEVREVEKDMDEEDVKEEEL